MKQKLQAFLAALIGLLVPMLSSAQTYSSWGLAVNNNNALYDTVAASGDSLHFRFLNTSASAYGSARLVIYYRGNIGDWFEYLNTYDEASNYIGQAGPNSYGYDCAPEDSTVITLSASQINAWNTNDTIDFLLIPNYGPGFCVANTVRAKLTYDWCAAGAPAQFASLSIPDSAVCAHGGPLTLTGMPAGGTFGGPGVSGSTFNPANLMPGGYTLMYTATDSLGCMTTGMLDVHVLSQPLVNGNMPVSTCYGTSALLHASMGAGFIWFADQAETQPLDTTSDFTTPVLTQTTTYWVSSVDSMQHFNIDTVLATDSMIVDENAIAGDDRGGIVVTPNYVYLNGDNAAVRYDLSLNPGTGIALPIRDGMFSDLRAGKIWSLWNSSMQDGPFNWPSSFMVDQLRGLDSLLNFTSDSIVLSQPIDMGSDNYQSGIFAGFGYLGLYSGNTQHWYVVDLDNGQVTDLGYLADAQFYGSENWADWGMLEADCNGNFSVIYRDYNDNDIHRRVLPNGPVTSVGTFPSGLSDMASLVFNPWNNRWYWHYEGSSTTFGGSAETLGYADATATEFSCGGNGLSCALPVTVYVPAQVTLNIATSNMCVDDGPLALTMGTPAGGTYSGIGVGTNASGTVFFPALSGLGTYTVTYTYTDSTSGCVASATDQITVSSCTGIDEQTFATGISIYPNPNNGVFTVSVNAPVNEMLLEVTDLQGRVLFSSTEKNVMPGFAKQLDMSTLSSGMYMLRLTAGDQQQVRQVSIQH